MSYSIDANLLLISVDEESPYHRQAKKFLLKVLTQEDLCVLGWETVYAFLRIATHHRIFKNPLSIQVAVENIQALLDHPRVEIVGDGKQSWEIFVGLTKELPVKDNLVPDAMLAALLESHGVRKLYTRDRDFRKFDYLDPVDPILSAI